MKRYLVNKQAQPTGEHEVHHEHCDHLPELNNRLDLGYFNNCQAAVEEARKHYSNVDGCYYCCNDCHTR